MRPTNNHHKAKAPPVKLIDFYFKSQGIHYIS